MTLTPRRTVGAAAASNRPRRWIASFALALALPVALQADTLYLRDGSRVQGELIAVRNGQIEFEERRGFGGGRTLRFDRDEVDRIEFENRRFTNNNNNSNNTRDRAVDGRPSGMRERQTIVSADVAWNDTGIDVRAGQTVFFEAQGRVRWGRDRQDGPAGERNSPSNPNRPMGNRNAAALIGKIGDDMFFIGDDTGPIRMRSGGRLYLGINDDVLTDNSGNFRVVVYY
ncbi:MAG TPA: LecA/PA-IL family lectin [Vicinamibacterales bacterium]|nr:LecA/PA-IL family lectin [Vicinamibacterales bacterium]